MQTVTSEPKTGPKMTAAAKPVAEATPAVLDATLEAPPLSVEQPAPRREASPLLAGIRRWFDNSAREYTEAEIADRYAVDWIRIIPYIALHLTCFAVIWVGWSAVAVGVAAALYAVHMFAITAFYHRYFSHRTFKTSRIAQFIFAVVGCSAVQRGPIWWAARHRHHHRHSDEDIDVHSPIRHGLYWSHVGWITSKSAYGFDAKAVTDLTKFPELRLLNRFDMVIPAIEAVALFALGVVLDRYGWNTTGWQMLIWGFFISTVVCGHATFTINSLTHLWGTRRYKTKDHSRNNIWLALLTFGEGWHNNHHYYPGAVRQGFYWWEIDITYYCLYAMSLLGIIWDLNGVPNSTRESHHTD